jgi:hypothetical protein
MITRGTKWAFTGAASGARGIGRMEDTFHLYKTQKSFSTFNEILYSSSGTQIWGRALYAYSPRHSVSLSFLPALTRRLLTLIRGGSVGQ